MRTSTKDPYMNTSKNSTYNLLVRSEEKSRGAVETVLYSLFIFSSVLAIWQFVHNPVNIPAAGIERCSLCATQPAHVNLPG